MKKSIKDLGDKVSDSDKKEAEDLAKMLCGEKCDIFPTIDDGLRSQKILDAILESSEKCLYNRAYFFKNLA